MRKISLIIIIILLAIIILNIENVVLFFNNRVFLLSKAEETTSISGVLGRQRYVSELCDDFEDSKWDYYESKHECYRGFWRKSHRGDPEVLERIPTPPGGKSGSQWALEIRTSEKDKIDKRPEHYDEDASQEDLQTTDFKQILGHDLTRAEQPVFIVRVWLPPFDQWIKGDPGNPEEDYYNFGFRQRACQSNNSKEDYYPSIWLHHDSSLPSPCFVFRFFETKKVLKCDIPNGSIKQPGWWTLAVAYDKEGIDHYYARPGVGALTEEDEMFGATQFRATYGIDTPSMVRMGYGLFTLGYPKDGNNTSPTFVIDDYEVWVVK